jgi:peptidyl-prolyl cis-trans isomerase D
MLESFRNAAKSWVAKILLLLLAASFAIWGIEDTFRGSNAGALATVGDRQVTAEEYQQSLRQTLQTISRSTGQSLSQEEVRALGYDRIVRENLIHQAALDTQADKLKLAVGTRALEASTLANPAFHGPGGQFDPAAFNNMLQANNMNEAMYIASETREMKREAIVGSVTANFTLPNTLVEALAKFRSEQRDARFFLIRGSLADVAEPSDSDLKQQYEKTPAAYTAPEYRSVAVLKVEPSDIAAKIAVADEELRAAYEQRKTQFATPERRTILQIAFPNEDEARAARAKLAAGQDFAALAQERGLKESDYLLADKTAGELLDPKIAEAAFKLPQGEVSDVVKGNLVTALLKVNAITPGKQPLLDEVKDKLREQLQVEKAREELQTIFDNVENARNNQAKLEDIAREQGLPFQLVPAVSAAGLDKQGKDVSLPDKAEVLKAAFSSDVGDVTSPLHPNETYIWYDVLEVVPSALKPFDEVKSQARDDLKAAKLRDMLAERAKKIVDSLKTGATLEQAAAQEKSEVKQAQGLRRNEATPEFDIASLSALFSLPPEGFGWGLEGDGQSAKIMQAATVLSPPFDPASAEAAALKQSLTPNATASLATSFLGALRQNIPVSVNETVWQQLAGSAP